MTRLNRAAFFLISLTIVVTTMFYGAVHPPVIELFYLLIVAMVVLWAFDGLLNGKFAFSTSWLQIPLFGLGVYGLVQVIPFGSYGSADVSDVPRTITLFPFATKVSAVHILFLSAFFGLTLAALGTAARIRRMAAVITVFGFLYAFYAILQSVLSPTKIYGIYEVPYAIPFGSFVNRHDFAAFIEMAVAVPLGLLFGRAVPRDKRLIYLVIVVLMGASLLLSGSRGGLIAILCELLMLIILTAGGKGARSLALKAALCVLLAGAIVGGAVFVGGDTSLTRFAETAASRDVTSNRTHIWAVTLRIIGSNMPFGVGLGAYPEAYTQHDTSNGLATVEQAHNDYLQLLSDAGVIGLALGLLFLALFVREGIRSSRRHNAYRRAIGVGAFAGCTAVLIHSVFDFVLHTTAISVMFLTLMGMMIAAGRRYDDDITEFDEPERRHRRSARVTPIRGRAS
jgi:O-antigen ligase